MADFDSLVGALVGIPRLDGARCKGRSGTWDLPESDEPPARADARLAAAIAECNVCPALADCRKWIASLRPSKRPLGVVAGQLITPPKHRKAS